METDHQRQRREALLPNRKLSPHEFDLLVEIQTLERSVLLLQEKVRKHINLQLKFPDANVEMAKRADDSEASRFCSIAKTELQMGFMALQRAVEQPPSMPPG